MDNQYGITFEENTEVNYIGVLNYLRDNAGVPYSNPEADGIEEKEKQRLLEVKQRGRVAIAELKKMATVFAEKYKLDKYMPMTWLDSSNIKTRRYLWAQLKYSKYADIPISISVFVERIKKDSTRYRVSLEIKNDGTNKEEMSQYHSHLDLPLNTAAGLVYVSGSNEWGNPVVINESQEEIKQEVVSGKIKKVQICKFVERKGDETNLYYHTEISKVIEALIPYYEYVIGIETIEYFPSLSEYDPGIIEEEYERILGDENLVKRTWLDTIYYLYLMGGVASCKQIANKYGSAASHYNRNATHVAEAVHKETNCPLHTRETGENQYWPVLFWGKALPTGSEGTFSYKLREPLMEAIKKLEERGVFQEMEEAYNMAYDKNLILYGPPGTGKTYNSAIYAVAICDGMSREELTDYAAVMARYNELKKAGRIAFTTFHQSYGYEEFIEGIKPVVDDVKGEIGYTIEPGIFKKFCEKAEKCIAEPHIFIIDEINRGNISKIFGELITLIECTKREGMPEEASAVLPYSGKEFTVPSNVYILGTMNTADRSIALMDTALRRRFQFIEMMPDTQVLVDIHVDKVEDLNVAAMLEKINERITFLYDREHTIGHAFFTELQGENATIEKLQSIFEKSVIPLLQEYFYEDYKKIQLVLGDNAKSSSELKFIVDHKVVAKDIFKGNVEDVIDLPEKRYSINQTAFTNLNSYKEIL